MLDAVYREVLEPAFDTTELDPLDVVREGLSGGAGNEIWGLCAVDGRSPLGCVLGYPFEESRVLLVGNIAARPDRRGRGIGGLLLEEAKRRWCATRHYTLVVAEIEDPRHHPVVGDIDPLRRVAFYARRGAMIVVGPYFLPRLRESTGRVYDLFLTVLHADEQAIRPRRSVSAHQIADFLQAYFEASEGSDPRGDEQGRWLLAWYHSRDTVALHSIDGYAEIEIPPIPGRS